MFCPFCGQPTPNDGLRFCRQCGFRLDGVSQLLANGGSPMLPQPIPYPTTDSPRRKGLKFGLKLTLTSLVMFPLVLAFAAGAVRSPVPLFLPFTVFLAGVARMIYERREFIALTGATTLAAMAPDKALSQGKQAMYGLIGKMTAVEGKRDAMIAILLEGVAGMPGCLSYIVAKDPADANAIWITEVWDSEQSHKASLSLPAVKEAIQKGRPLIAGFSDGTVTEPVGGYGLVSGKSK